MRSILSYTGRQDVLVNGRTGIKIFILAVVFCGFFLSSCSSNSAKTSAVKPDKAPDFTLKDLSGVSVSLSDFSGKKGVFIIFTTTWCPHCVTVIPDLKKVYNGSRNKNLHMVAVYIKESNSNVSEFKAEHGITYEILLDSDAAVASLYNVMGVPTFVLVDKNGNIRYKGHDIPKDTIERIAGE